MHPFTLPFILALGSTATSSPVRRATALSVKSTVLLGNVTSDNTHVYRDLGFYGRFGSNILYTYGDTTWKDAAYSNAWEGIVPNSVAQPTNDVLLVHDPKLNTEGYPEQFVDYNTAWGETNIWGMGVTSVVEVDDSTGAVFYLRNNRTGGINRSMGSGVATVTMDGTVPVTSRSVANFWDSKTEPNYGDVCALRDGDYIYAYGHADNCANQIFVTRVNASSYQDIDAYEYWNGNTWQTDRLYNVVADQSVGVWAVMQGGIFYSPYLKAYVFTYTDNWNDGKILAVTGESPVGPWSDPVTLYTATLDTPGSYIYAASPRPGWDKTGKTLVVVYTNSVNYNEAIRVTFN